MNEFVEECRNEWRRLGVPDQVADEMAAELEADLDEAETEGVSAEAVLGSGALDPRSFATAWAVERGVGQPTPPDAHELPRRARVVAAIGAFAIIAVIGGALITIASSSGPTRLALAAVPGIGPAVVSPDGRTIAYVSPPAIRQPAPAPGELRIGVDGIQTGTARLLFSRGSGLAVLVPTQIVAADDAGMDTRTMGWVLLTVGLAGFVPFTMYSLWVAPGPHSRRRAR